MTIRAATPADIPAIAAIQQASPEAAHWSPLEYLRLKCWVALAGASVAGFIVVRPTGPGEWEILNLAVEPASRRQGLGRALIQAATASVEVAQQAWFLEVRESNQAALALYESAGFEPTGRRENYYGNPPEAAIVMRRVS